MKQWHPQHRTILRLAIPNIITNVTIPVLGMVDLALMGHLENTAFIGAVSIGNVLLNFVFWGLAFFRMSTSGITAQANGADNKPEVAGILIRGILLAIGLGLLLVMFGPLLKMLAYSIMPASAEVLEISRNYFSIRLLAAPFALANMVFSGWFLGMHNARIPMYNAILVNVVNIVANVLFVRFLGMNADGVAWGTNIAQLVGFAGFLYTVRKHQFVEMNRISWGLLMKWQSCKKFLRVSNHIFFRTLCVILVFTFFTAQSGKMGNEFLALNALLREFLLFFAFFMDGLAYAAEPIAGELWGKRNFGELKPSVGRLFRWAWGVALFSTIVFALGHRFILQLLTNQNNVLDLASQYIGYAILLPLAGFAGFLWDGIFIGITATRKMLYTLLMATFGVFFPLFYCLNLLVPPNHALWLAMLGFLLSRGIIQTIMARKIFQ